MYLLYNGEIDKIQRQKEGGNMHLLPPFNLEYGLTGENRLIAFESFQRLIVFVCAKKEIWGKETINPLLRMQVMYVELLSFVL